MSKLDFEQFMLKVAEDDQLADDASRLAEGLAAGATATTIFNGLSNIFNVAERQDIPLGEAFANYAKGVVESSKSRPSILYLQSVPRKMSDIAPGGPLIDFLAHPPSYVQSTGRDYLGNYERMGLAGAMEPAEQLANNIRHELAGHIHPDRLSKNPLLAVLPTPVIAAGLTDNTHLMITPRNNLSVMAHEFGHIEGDELLRGRTGNDVLDMARNAAASVWEGLSGSTDTFLNKIPGVGEAYRAIESATPLPTTMKNILRNVFLAPSPIALAGGTLALSKKARDAVASIDPTGKLDEVMETIEENPVSTMALATMPSLIHEAYTMIPGAKLTYGFWDKVNKGGVSGLRSLRGKASPIWETAKFLGRNALPLLGAAAPLIGVAAARYLGDREENVSTDAEIDN